MEDESSDDLTDEQEAAYAQLIMRQHSTTRQKPGDTIGIEEFLLHAVDAGNCDIAIATSIKFLKELENPNGNSATSHLRAKNDDGRQLLWLARTATSCRKLGEELLHLSISTDIGDIRKCIQVALQFRGQMHYIVEFMSGRSKLAIERSSQITKRGRGNAKLTPEEWQDVLDMLLKMVAKGDKVHTAAAKISTMLSQGKFPGITGSRPVSTDTIARKERP